MSSNSVNLLLAEIQKINGVTEVIINSPQKIFIEKSGELIQIDAELDKKEINEFCKDVARNNNKILNKESPILNGNLKDGSRVNIIIEPYAKNCPAITIRKYIQSIKYFKNNENIFSLNKNWILFLKTLINSKSNIIVSGGTGVGKTTFLNLLLQEINPKERIITIEDTLELNFKQPNTVKLEAISESSNAKNISTRELVKNSLRMRPDRIIIGEVRGGEVFDLLQAMNTGHDGSMTSVHSNSTKECLVRIESLFMLAGFDIPIKSIRQQMSQAIDFIIQISRDKKGRRVVQQISEICNLEGDVILRNDIAKYDQSTGNLIFNGVVPSNMKELEKNGLPSDFWTKV
jgi:pilus assembly protein CpaF